MQSKLTGMDSSELTEIRHSLAKFNRAEIKRVAAEIKKRKHNEQNKKS